ncbi:rhomboid family intramembrane serine protease [Clostridium folliculivorans]|uniref:Rhomboid family intramembrane serine protease n=1 Tax=Clostridium folliculivorans TaxID=2886038 RepID=A0A9W6DDF7_9CLOT|nr:rhomboid family intramembrane serine protease [Clostridium folliculivorans]GKU27751.1 hypothetical protein CFOLD11_45780 [Clostridium folliculivorans]GKU32551.1 hypothetical protein CFB3_46590 [Clostridium folliculivorans]
MQWLNKLERKFGRFAIKNLMMYIVGANLFVYLVDYLFRGNGLSQTSLSYKLAFIPSLVLKGEVWRIITFIFIPPASSPIFIIFVLYFYYMIGSALENEWGSFKFNIYYFVGVIGTIIAGFISGGASGEYLTLSLFLAFAYVYPDYQILLFFILPIKIKYLAWLDAAFLALSFFGGGLDAKLAIVAALINFVLFFGKDILSRGKHGSYAYNNKKRFKNKTKNIKLVWRHKCEICGITENDDPTMEFRYCSICEGNHEYCINHLRNHEHVRNQI